MPILINTEGMAENVPLEQSHGLLQQGSHTIPLNDPQGNPVSASLQESQNLLKQGFSQPSPEQLNSLLKHAKYSTGVEQAKTFGEKAASAASFGLSTGAETALGVKPEDVRAREEINPGVALAGEVTGLVASDLAGYGAGPAIAKIGKAASNLVKIGEGAGIMAKAAQTAINQATQFAMISAGDEVSRAFAQDPEQTLGTAAINVGLSGLMGGVIGGAARSGKELLWEAANGSKLAELLNGLKTKAMGRASADAADKLAQESGITLSPEMKATLSGDASAKDLGAALMESNSKAGKALQRSFEDFHKQAQEGLSNAVGRDIADLEGKSVYDIGQEAKKDIEKFAADKIKAIEEHYEPINKKFKSVEVGVHDINDMAEKIMKLAAEEGITQVPGSVEMSEVSRFVKDLPHITDLKGLQNAQSDLGKKLYQQGSNKNFAGKLMGVIREAEGDVLAGKVGQEAPELLEKLKLGREAQKDFFASTETLRDRLSLGKLRSPKDFIKALAEMAPEDIMRKLNGKGDADLLNYLKESLPEVANKVKDLHINELLGKASSKQAEGINPKAFLNNYNKLSPELQSFVGDKAKIESIEKLVRSMPDRLNPSGTAKTLDQMWKHMPGGIGAMILALAHGNPVLGYILGQAGRYIGREVPDALKLSMLKFLGSDMPINSAAFKTMVEAASASYKGARILDKAIQGAVTGAKVIDIKAEPKNIEKLDKLLKVANYNPEKQVDQTGNLNHYMPDHAMEAGALSARAINYLNGLRPDTSKPGILDPERVPSEAEKTAYERQLAIAEQPALVLQHVRDGSVTVNDIKTISTLYPRLYENMKTKMVEAVINHKAKDGNIPYDVMLGMSLFLGQPLESSIMPQNTLSNQQVYAAMAQQQSAQQQASQAPKSRPQNLNNKDLPSQATSGQSGEARKAQVARR